MTFSEFSKTVPKFILIQNVGVFFHLFKTSDAKPDVNQIVFLIEPAVTNLIVW